MWGGVTGLFIGVGALGVAQGAQTLWLWYKSRAVVVPMAFSDSATGLRVAIEQNKMIFSSLFDLIFIRSVIKNKRHRQFQCRCLLFFLLINDLTEEEGPRVDAAFPVKNFVLGEPEGDFLSAVFY